MAWPVLHNTSTHTALGDGLACTPQYLHSHSTGPGGWLGLCSTIPPLTQHWAWGMAWPVLHNTSTHTALGDGLACTPQYLPVIRCHLELAIIASLYAITWPTQRLPVFMATPGLNSNYMCVHGSTFSLYSYMCVLHHLGFLLIIFVL